VIHPSNIQYSIFNIQASSYPSKRNDYGVLFLVDGSVIGNTACCCLLTPVLVVPVLVEICSSPSSHPSRGPRHTFYIHIPMLPYPSKCSPCHRCVPIMRMYCLMKSCRVRVRIAGRYSAEGWSSFDVLVLTISLTTIHRFRLGLEIVDDHLLAGDPFSFH